MNGILEQAAGHDRIEPRDTQPGELTDGIGEGMQSCSLVVIRRHFISESDKGCGINRIGQEEENRHAHEVPEITNEEGLTLSQFDRMNSCDPCPFESCKVQRDTFHSLCVKAVISVLIPIRCASLQVIYFKLVKMALSVF